jgi:hypothetical protein
MNDAGTFRAACISLFVLSLLHTAARAADESTWEAAVNARCPTHHLEWTCDDCWDAFLADFERTLPKVTQGRILKIANYSRRCSREVGGFSCEMSVHVDAMHKLGLLGQFADYGCAHYRCEEAAICTRTPVSSAVR